MSLLARPFYVYTPRNVFGEHLKACPYRVRAVHTGKQEHFESFDWEKINQEKDRLNLQYQTEQCFAAFI